MEEGIQFLTSVWSKWSGDDTLDEELDVFPSL